MATTVTSPGPMPDPNDFTAFSKWRDAGGGDDSFADAGASPAGDEELSDTDPAEAGAQEPEGAVEAEADENDIPEPAPQAPAEPGKKGARLERRFRYLTDQVKELRAQLEADEEIEEIPEPPVAAAAAVEALVAPKLADFAEFEEWRAAYDLYHEAKTNQQLDGIRRELQVNAAQQVAQREAAIQQEAWTAQATRWPDFGQRLASAEENGAKISPAMRTLLMEDPEFGTRMAYYLSGQPGLCTEISRKTLASTPEAYQRALARAGIELAKLVPLLQELPAAGGKHRAAAETAPKPGTRPGSLVRTATRPAAPLVGAAPVATNPVYDEEVAKDFGKWNRAREAEIKRRKNG